MKRIACLIAVLMAAMPGLARAEDPVYFADANLKTRVEAALGISDPTPTDMLALTMLSAGSQGITDLTGLEYATNLTTLYLQSNQISDISALGGLTNLTYLRLNENQISDTSAVAGLTNLTALYLRDNQISDISALGGLTNLTVLYLNYNQISDISALSAHTNLELLYLTGNPLNPDACNIYIPQILANNPGITLGYDPCVEPPVYFADENLKARVEAVLGGSDPTPTDMLALTTLSASSRGITDPTGLEYATNLTLLGLGSNQISDISAVAGLTNLTVLLLHSNQISDISEVAGLTNLEELSLGSNQISDISPLDGLTNLSSLGLHSNQIGDISALDGLTNLTSLVLSNNQISDISPLDGLTNLMVLSLRDNQISDISAVSGLTNLTELSLSDNQISDISAVSGLTNLMYLELEDNQISDISSLTGLTNLDELDLRGNPLNLDACDIYIPQIRANNPGIELDYEPCVEEPVYFADENLKARVEAVLGVSDPTPTDMLALTTLSASSRGITDPTGLEYATNLTLLGLGSNQISDISALDGLTNLTSLVLSNNQISDISAVAGLTNLSSLSLGSNQISDISPLDGLTNLSSLGLHSNQIGDISALAGLTKLRSLNLDDNQISDISPLDGLTNLSSLGLHSNQISDISAVAGLTNLTTLGLDDNQISDISALSGLTNLEELNLEGNPLNQDACNIYIPQIRANNPGITIRYDPCIVVQYTLTISSTSGGSVSNPGEGSFQYDHGTVVSIVATAEANYHFVNWTGTAVDAGKVAEPSAGSTTVTVDADYTLQANFAIDQRTLTVSSTSGGSVTEPGEGSFPYDHGTFVPVTAQAEANYHFVNWTGTAVDAGKVADPSSASTTVTVDADYTLQANFTPGPVQEPTVTTRSATSVGETFATLWGFIDDDGGEECWYRFCYHKEDGSYEYTPWVWSATTDESFSEDITGLNPGSVYYFTAEAENSAGSSYSDWESFTTLPIQDTLTIIYVDDDAPNDPEPNNPALSDPNEDGSSEHPFDMIQEGIDAALDGETVIVRDGTYWEAIEFAGRNITVTGFDPNEPNAIPPYPVIDASYIGTAVTFCNEEEPNCILEGFVITRGAGEVAGGINCVGSSPTISRCLIVGNRVMNPNGGGGAVFCIDSNAVFENCTFSGNYGGEQDVGLLIYDSNVVLLNSILWDNGREVFVAPGSLLVTAYCDIQGGWWGTGNMIEPPLFAEPGYWAHIDAPEVQAEPSDLNAIWIDGDYHLLSEHGRYWPEHDVWVFDKVTSPCIDAGDPNTFIGEEPFPNGDIINMGAYGGTAEASKSTTTTNAFLRFDLESDPGWAVEGDWQFGRPLGAGGANGNPDPSSGYTGTNVYGVNLAGDYRVAVGGPYYLTAGPFNCSGYQQISLRFVRWLNSDFYPYVANTLEVSNDGQTWQVIWKSQDGQKLADSEWQVVDYDISAVADGQPAVYVRWSYEIVSDRAFDYSGWNIDDIELRAVP